MKTERAIELLKRISDSQFDGPHGDERREALSMAVRALEQNLVQESDDLVHDLVQDCISRKMAIEYLMTNMCWYDEDGYESDDDYKRECITDLINGVPSAQPQRKKGKWIKLDMHAHLADHKCTACGQECYVPTCMGEPMYTYCPNCGCRMEGDEHE